MSISVNARAVSASAQTTSENLAAAAAAVRQAIAAALPYDSMFGAAIFKRGFPLFGASWAPAISFAMLLGILAVRPQGLFGRRS